MDPFRAHLAALLSIYELGPSPGTPTIPRYEGPTDWQTETILKSLDAVARRMYSAEETVGNLQKQLKRGTVFEESRQQVSHKVGPVDKKISSPPRRVNMTISLDDLRSSTSTDSDPFNLSSRAYGIEMKAYHQAQAVAATNPRSHNSAPTTTHVHSPGMTPLIIPPGPFSAPAFEVGMNTTDELRLLKAQVSDIARVCNAVARGDLSQKITVPVQGVVMVQLKDVVNTMVDRLGQFAKEITRISQEIGTERKLGGQTVILEVEGIWQTLIGVVNKSAANLVR